MKRISFFYFLNFFLLLFVFSLASLAEDNVDIEDDVSINDFLSNLPSYIKEVEEEKRSFEWLSKKILVSSIKRPKLNSKEISEVFELSGFGEVFFNDYEEFLKKSLLKNHSKGVPALIGLNDLLKDRDFETNGRCKELIELVQDAETLVESGNLETLNKLIYSSSNLEYQNIVLTRQVPLLLKKADKILSEDPMLALKELSEIPKEWRGKAFNEMAKKVLKEIDLNLDNNLDVSKKSYLPELDELCSDLEQSLKKDEPSILTLAKLYSRWVIEFMMENDVKSVDSQYEKVVRIRLDPNKLNDDLRLKVILIADTKEEQVFAQARKEELVESGSVGVYRKIWLLFHGYYGDFYLHIVLGCVIFFVSLGLLWLFFEKIVYYFRDMSLDKSLITKPVVKLLDEKTKVNLSGYLQPVTKDDVYSTLLAKFNLDDNATEEEIKVEYRKKIKELHPDKYSGAESERKAQELIEVKKAYERILEIRKSQFKNRKN